MKKKISLIAGAVLALALSYYFGLFSLLGSVLQWFLALLSLQLTLALWPFLLGGGVLIIVWLWLRKKMRSAASKLQSKLDEKVRQLEEEL